MSVSEVLVEEISYNPSFNCRGAISPSSVQELAADINENGLINAITIRKVDPEKYNGHKYQVVAGFRRFMAITRVLKWKKVPCNIYEEMDDKQAALINLSENIGRQNLNLLQEAKSLKRLMELGYTEEEICEKIGRSRGWLQPRLMLIRMPETVQALAETGILNASHIRELYKYKDHKELDRVARDLYKKAETGGSIIKIPKPKSSRSDPGYKKRHRKRVELMDLLQHFNNEKVPFGLHTRVLAWAAGEISDYELGADIQEYCFDHSIEYQIPENGFPSYHNEHKEALLR